MAKFWLDSSTIKSGLFVTVAGLVLVGLNPVANIFSRNYPARAEDIKDFKELIESLISFAVAGGGATTVLSKIGSKEPIYTPDGWFGADKSDFEREPGKPERRDNPPPIAPGVTITRIDAINHAPDTLSNPDEAL